MRSLKLTASDRRCVSQLLKLADSWSAGRQAPPLFAARPAFRQIADHQSLGGLLWCLEHRRPEVRRIAIWLLGRSSWQVATPAVVACARDRDVRVRREVARALRRLRAWSELRRLANDDDTRVRRLAAPRVAQSFAERMTAFVRSGITPATRVAPPQPMPLVWNVPHGTGRRPKSEWFVGARLQRLRRLIASR